MRQSRTTKRGRPTKSSPEKHSKRVMVNLTPHDYERLMREYDPRVYPHKTEYLRARLLDRRIEVNQRNQSLDEAIPVLVAHNDALTKQGVNLNQLVRHLNTYQTPAYQREVLELLRIIKTATELQEQSQRILHQIHEKWS